MPQKFLYPSFKVLIVDDEEPFIRSLSIALERSAGINNITRCQDSREVMGLLAEGGFGLVLLDLNMPWVSGDVLLEKIIEEYPEVGVIIISGINQIEPAVRCMKLGAYDYFVKTNEEDRLVLGVNRAIQMVEMSKEHKEIRSRLLHDRLENPDAFESILTCDKAMRAIFQYLESVSKSAMPILITGESGVGKDLIAHTAHCLSGAEGPLVSINVAGLDDNVFSDTLFGHAPGAFTSAHEVRKGMIEQAAHGTLFLDEIGDLSVTSQVKLLRLIQNGEYYPLGSDRPKRMNARIVVATNQDLDRKQAKGEFRKDLYYRLCAHHVHIPPLRERKDDIALLLNHFLGEAAESLGKKRPTYPRELEVLLANYAFPGNIRELQAMVYDAVSTHKSKMLSLDAFKRKIGAMTLSPEPSEPSDTHEDESIFVTSKSLPSIHDVTDLLVGEAMKRADGNQSIASRLIGISQPALSKRLKKLKLNE
ncbi:sigma-54 dependent transcriptional regulator [Desulfoluna sp.]|uniref:sigma-54-dependent transcriptional regulator n=1 Tax=Desulfoluna sp. TaxID=2045199 RepID=UPI002608200D|nr:sigma-54 dependent transcriptional regulator [Desulfoluna sp.]